MLCGVPDRRSGREQFRVIGRFLGLSAAILLGCGLGGCVTTTQTADPTAVAQANAALHKMDQQKVRLMIARMLEDGRWYNGGGAPRISDPKIRAPIEKTDRASGLPYLEYCASATMLSFITHSRSALVNVLQQPDGRTRVTIFMKPYGGTCSGADQPFPEFEQLRNERRKAMGKDV